MLSEAWIGPVIIAATIAGLVNILGWVVAGSRERNAERRRRRERIADLQTALRAEIQHYVDALALFDPDQTWDAVVSRMEADEAYVPLIPSERNDTVFCALLAEVHLLPGPVIQPVVRYYNQVFAIEALIDDLRDPRVGGLVQSQRIAMYTDYIALKKEALVQGRAALAAIDESLAGRVSNPDAGRSGQR